MSSEENQSQNELREEHLSTLRSNTRALNSNIEEIQWVFKDTFKSDRIHNNYDDYRSTMESVLDGVVNEGDESDVASALINTILNFNRDVYNELADIDNEFAHNIKSIANKYGLAIQRRVQRIHQGHEYWSNVKSDVGVRSDKPRYRHELIIDYEEILSFDSSANGTAILSRHLLEQLESLQDTLGDDALTFVSRAEVERINEISESLLTEFDELDIEGDESAKLSEISEEDDERQDDDDDVSEE